MTKTQTSTEPREKDTALESALAYYATRENHELLEGMICPDNNNKNNVLVIISSTEFYSVPIKDLIYQDRIS